MHTIEADYLVCAGAMRMAFVDALVSEIAAHMVLRLLAQPLGAVPIPGTKRAEYVRGERRRSRLPRRCLDTATSTFGELIDDLRRRLRNATPGLMSAMIMRGRT
jgi:uncharacterized protein with von Willebrand factor type A (vWA) domain